MLTNSPGSIKSTAGESNDVFSTLLNTDKCLVEGGMQVQKTLDSHPAAEKLFYARGLDWHPISGEIPREESKDVRDPPNNGSTRRERPVLPKNGVWGMATGGKEKGGGCCSLPSTGKTRSRQTLQSTNALALSRPVQWVMSRCMRYGKQQNCL